MRSCRSALSTTLSSYARSRGSSTRSTLDHDSSSSGHRRVSPSPARAAPTSRQSPPAWRSSAHASRTPSRATRASSSGCSSTPSEERQVHFSDSEFDVPATGVDSPAQRRVLHRVLQGLVLEVPDANLVVQLPRLVDTDTSGERVTIRLATSSSRESASKVRPRAACVDTFGPSRSESVGGTCGAVVGRSGCRSKRRGSPEPRPPPHRRGPGIARSACRRSAS